MILEKHVNQLHGKIKIMANQIQVRKYVNTVIKNL